MRKNAIRLSESRLGGKGYIADLKIKDYLIDSHPQVRLQLAFSLGNGKDDIGGEFLANPKGSVQAEQILR